MKFLLRVDDFGWTDEESEAPPLKKRDIGLRLAQKFHAALDGIPYLAGVIPSEVDDRGIDWLMSCPDGLSVALHGWNHSPGKERHEFHGLSPDSIRELISRGQKKIGPTPYFIPPFNSFAHAHAAPMWHEGIRYVFGRDQAWASPPSPYELEMGVMFIPAWARLYGALGWKQGSASNRVLDELYVLFPDPGIAVLTLHLPWEAARDPEFKHTKTLARVWREHFVSAEEFVKRIR